MRNSPRSLASFLLALSLVACGGGPRTGPAPGKDPKAAKGDAASKADAPPTTPAAPAGERKLNVYIWSEYLPQEVVDRFAKEKGIATTVDTYDSNEALLEKLQSGVADYDVVVPSDYMVRILIAEKLVQPLQKDKLPNLKNLDPRFLDHEFDKGNAYSLPYFWGTTGLGYNKEKVKEPVDSWSVVFDPAHAGRILMLDDMRECFGVALKLMGKPLNEKDPEVLKQAAAKLKEQKKLVKTYNSGDFANILASGDVDLAHGYNGQLAAVIAENPDKLGFALPKEGGTIWMDNVAIASGARHVDEAHAFLDFVMDAEVNASIVNVVRYASPNAAARAHIDPKIVGDPIVYPPDDVVARCEFMEDIGETTTLLDQYWTEIKAQ